MHVDSPKVNAGPRVWTSALTRMPSSHECARPHTHGKPSSANESSNFEISDDSEPRMRSSFLHRALLEERDEHLVAAVTRIHEERDGQAISVGVAYGAAHLPAVVQTLVGRLGCRLERGGEWLLAIDF